jgi:hypothetical protein
VFGQRWLVEIARLFLRIKFAFSALVSNCTAASVAEWNTPDARDRRTPKSQEETVREGNDYQAAELHTKAAYAHAAAACSHSTGDHATAQELARLAFRNSAEAVQHTEEIAKDALHCGEV